MSPFALNALVLFACSALVLVLAVALTGRIGSWQISTAATLNLDDGLRIGEEAPQIACYLHDQEMHLSFGGQPAFVVFGTAACPPCKDLLEIAVSHPATKPLRKVFVADSYPDVSPDVEGPWEIYTFHHEQSAREMWRAPVSPYFHVIDSLGRIAAKGIANRPEHLDRLLALKPTGLPADTLGVVVPKRE
jgi:hypothetical protein